MSHDLPSPIGRIGRAARNFADGWNRIGEQAQFYARTLRSIGDVIVHYRIEVVRLIAQMGLGTGALLVIGGSVGIIGFVLFLDGAITSELGYDALSGIGVQALIGYVTAFSNVRLAVPLLTTVALSATIGAGATAQLGAMRISEEIDALEAMSVRSLAYLASSRVLTGVLVVMPLFCMAVIAIFLGSAVAIRFYSVPSGVYNHYFNTFLNPSDMIKSFFVVTCSGIVVMLIHTYYGYNASGGPAGVGEAVGRAVRTSMAFATFVVLFVSLAAYGPTAHFHLSG